MEKPNFPYQIHCPPNPPTPPLYAQHPLMSLQYRGGKNLVWENFCPEKFRRGKIPPQSLKVMGKIAPELAVRNFDTALTINWQLHVVGSLKCPEG